MWEPSERYPDPAIQILDPASRNTGSRSLGRTARHRLPLVRRAGVVRRRPLPAVERHPEQPHPEMGGGDRRGQRLPPPSNNANGNTRDRQGRLVTCEHAAGASPAPNTTARSPCCCDRYQGKRLNSPNDVVVKSDGTIWFTDPPFGIGGNYEGDSGRARDRRRTSIVSTPQTGALDRRRRRRRRGRTGWRSRPTRAALHRRIPRRAEPRDPGLRRGGRRPAAPTSRVLIDAGPRHAGRLPRRRRRQSVVRLGHGRRRSWTACGSSTPRASRSATSRCPSAAPTSASAAATATACSWRRATGCTRCT